MPSRDSEKPAHRTWIDQARLQSEAFERAAAALGGLTDEGGAALVAADYFPGYELQREIHRGAQGAVFRAVQKSTGRRVALKLLHDSAFGGPLERARFEREMRVLAVLRHPNIVTIHDGGSHNGRFFLVMDYIAGQPLDLYMASQPRSIRETLELFIAICDAVNAAHVRGIIHRDLKPANVRVDAAGRPFVLDFGLAKLTTAAGAAEAGIAFDSESGESRAGSSLPTAPRAGDAVNGSPAGSAEASPRAGPPAEAPATLTGQFLGSLPWAAPEQAEGAPTRIDMRTDVYSLGVLLFHMLTGKFPYPVAGPMKAALDAIIHRAPAPPRQLRRDIDDELQTIVLKCLSKERERRYQTAGELARDLRRYLAGEPIEAKRDSGWYLLKKGIRRHRLSVGAAAAFVLMLAAFGIVMASARVRAQREADKYRQVLSFLQDMLAGVDPEDVGKEGLTFRAVLDQAAARLEHELGNQPEVAASVHQSLGSQYSTLGLYFDADRHLRKSVELRRSVARSDDAQLAEALTDLGANLLEKRDIWEAEAPTREALAMRRRLFGDASLEVAGSSYGLACILLEQAYSGPTIAPPPRAALTRGSGMTDEQRAQEAEQLARTSLDVRRRHLGAQHADVAASTALLGWCLMGLGRLDEAESALRDTIEAVRRLPGDNERALATHLTYLRDILRAQGNLAEEEKALREAIDIRSRRLAPNHPALAWNLICLAQIRRSAGDLEEAETACRRALAIYIERRDAQHTDIADCQQELAQIYDARGRHAEAEPWWSACVEMRRKLLPAGNPDLAFAEDGLARNRAAQRGDPGASDSAPAP